MRAIIAIGLIIVSYIPFPILTIQLIQLLFLVLTLSFGFYLLYNMFIGIVAIGIGISGVVMATALVSYALYLLA
ncbi:hypothetical protein AB3X48_19965 [Bacillus sp. S4]|uniref:hypothetical protein n=1 Tax=Bacillus sp. S4 TaxID=125884 RepID=UPI00349F1467